MEEDIFVTRTLPRLLIVDNNPRATRLYEELARLWGYEPFCAAGSGSKLIKDARRLAEEHRCQIALIDLHLVDDLDDEDLSGLDLIPEIWPTVAIMLSASPKAEYVAEAHERGADTFFVKTNDPEGLKKKLDKLAGRITAHKSGLKIDPEEAIQQIGSTFKDFLLQPFQDQIADALCILFPRAHHLRIEKLGRDFVSSGMATAPRPRSVILKGSDDGRQPLIVKLARREKIELEIKNFKQYIHRRLRGSFNPSLDNQAITWDIGAAAYTRVGNPETSRTFAEFYIDSNVSIETIDRTLTGFFNETWKDYYEGAGTAGKFDLPQTESLFRLYSRVWGEVWHTQKLATLRPPVIPAVMGGMKRAEIRPPNPLLWLRKHINSRRDESIIPGTRVAITHGDLHGDNLLVDRNDLAFVIDFERTGPGPILQDFVELESDIINRLTAANQSHQHYYALCLQIAAPNSLGPLPDPSGIADPHSRRSLEVISILRRLARDVTHVSDAREYLLGLLFNTLFRATMFDSKDLIGLQRAWMLASILCERLDHWDDPWPPKQWFPIPLPQEAA